MCTCFLSTSPSLIHCFCQNKEIASDQGWMSPASSLLRALRALLYSGSISRARLKAADAFSGSPKKALTNPRLSHALFDPGLSVTDCW
ncbi:hypothetical protein G0Q06_11930 [Puniceicoccales bacterium CK1056]|uniref:Uncharacterized protein n=1 Tax=Oceanipulchritudo coccoides TaxID=2706888 RepID=A0A6B2M500_9BACT|nr:hypothetical protein [Oceanipulchritudo coccoides]